jgi:outer membrane protein assembly factor BamA
MGALMKFPTYAAILISIFILSDPLSAKEDQKSGLVVIPAAFYTPETSVGFVTGILYYFQPASSNSSNRPSNLALNLIYTLENQIQSVLKPTFYIADKKYISVSEIRGIYYPKKFFGIGNDTSSEFESYTEQEFLFNTAFQIELFPQFHVGPLYQIQYFDISDTDENSSLNIGSIPGNEGGKVSGTGLLLSYDSRDNLFFSKSGFLIRFSASFYHEILASDYDYQKYSLDYRQYIPLYSTDHSLGFQFLLESASGEIPFQNLPMLGGQNLMRGIFKGRFRDKNLLSLQGEYRMKLSQDWHWVLFAGTGRVASRPENLSSRDLKTAFGSGIRYRVSESGLNLRLDLAYSPDEEKIRFYFTALEAF